MNEIIIKDENTIQLKGFENLTKKAFLYLPTTGGVIIQIKQDNIYADEYRIPFEIDENKEIHNKTIYDIIVEKQAQSKIYQYFPFTKSYIPADNS